MSLNTTETVIANETNFPGFEDRLPQKIIKVLMYCILLVVSFTGNLLIVWATSRDIRLRSTTNILIANMAVSDLLVPLFSMPRNIVYIIFYHGIWLIDGDFGLALCKLVHYVQDVSLGVSIYSCVFIALDRFYAVVYPLRGGLSKGKLKYIIPGIWGFSMAMFAIYCFTFTLTLIKTEEGSTECSQVLTKIGITTVQGRRIYHTIILSPYVAIPLPIISFLYLRIALALRRTVVPGQAGNTAFARERQNKNALKMSAVIVSLIFLSFLPFTVVQLLSVFGHLDNLSKTTLNDLGFSVTFIAESICAYNFFVYLVFTDVYRQNFKNLFSRCTGINLCPRERRSCNLQNVSPERGRVNMIEIN